MGIQYEKKYHVIIFYGARALYVIDNLKGLKNENSSTKGLGFKNEVHSLNKVEKAVS